LTAVYAGRRRRRLRLPGFRFLAVAPLLAFVGVFAGYPLVELVRMSFSHLHLANGNFDWSYTGVQNFRDAFHDAVFRHSIRITAVFILITTGVSVALGTALALLVDRARLLAGIAKNVLVWPAVIAPVVVSAIWWFVLNQQFGLLNKILDALGLPTQSWLAYGTSALLSVAFVDVWHWTPIVFLIVYAAIRSIDSSLLEAARVDRASEWQVIRYVVLPMLVPTLALVAGVRIVMGVKVFDEMYLLTNGGPGVATTLVSLYIRTVFFDQVDLGYGASLGLCVLLLVLVIFVAALAARGIARRVAAA
jgi:multiple sugar transport system permease protein